jgi:hypothetical protein
MSVEPAIEGGFSPNPSDAVAVVVEEPPAHNLSIHRACLGVGQRAFQALSLVHWAPVYRD